MYLRDEFRESGTRWRLIVPLTLAPEVDQMVRSLASLTGKTVEQALEQAVRDQLARKGVQQERDADNRAGVTDAELLEDVQAIAGRFQAHAGQQLTSTDHGELLYDEAGLPR
jgi:hypothetical protein